jgi:beta-glucanase (GH16 family)
MPVKKIALPMISFLMFIPSLFADASEPSKIQIGQCNFRQSFAEDFRDFHVTPWGDSGKGWIAHTPWAGDFGEAEFADPEPQFPFVVRDGVLTIEARKDAGGKWRSGLLASADSGGRGFAQQYGYFELRAKLPQGDGTWPAFWLATNKPRGSKDPGIEIDVMEHYGRFPAAFHSTVHVWNKPNGGAHSVDDHTNIVPQGSLYDSFHTYGVDVEPDAITFYLDRKEIWRTQTPLEHKRPLLVLIDLALGSGWPIEKVPNPSIMEIAYVRVFERSDAGC